MGEFHRRAGATKEGVALPLLESAELKDGLLQDFDIDDAKLKSNHTDYLNESLRFMRDRLRLRLTVAKPVADAKAWTVSIDGFASRTGSAQHNQDLSQLREISVETYLQRWLSTEPQLNAQVWINRNWHGFDDTPVKGELWEYRAVRVAIHRPELPPRPLSPPVAGSTSFKIRLLGIMSASYMGAQHDDAVLLMTDVSNHRAAIFQFIGAGGGIDVKLPLPPFSATLPGQERPFRTNKPVELAEFEGPAAFGQGPGVGPVSVEAQLSTENRTFIQKGVWTIPSSIPVNTGTTFGVSIFSATKGILIFHKYVDPDLRF